MTTPLVFGIFLIVGTIVPYLILVATEPVFTVVELPFGRIKEGGVAGLFGNLVIALLVVAPGQVIASAIAGLLFTIKRRLAAWLIAALICGCGAFATFRDLTVDGYLVTTSFGAREGWKLLYWTAVVAPGELIAAAIVAKGRLA